MRAGATGRRRLGALLLPLAAALLAGCSPPPPEGRPAPAREGELPPTGTPAPGVLAPCSGAVLGAPLPDQRELPEPVARTRRALFEAATACDFDALGALAGTGLHYSFGDAGDPVGHWQRLEEAGEPVVRRLAEILLATPAHAHGLWIWPGLFTRPAAEWNPTQRAEARRLLGEEGLAQADELGEYLAHRLAITPEGRWQYFVAGD